MEPTSGGFCTNNQTGYGVVSPFSVTDDTPPLLHMYGNVSSTADTTIPTTADSFTNYYADGSNLDLPTRKRSRDSSTSNYYNHHHLLQNPRSSCVNAATTTSTTPFSFLGQDIDLSSHINHQQHEIDRFISLHVSSLYKFASMAQSI